MKKDETIVKRGLERQGCYFIFECVQKGLCEGVIRADLRMKCRNTPREYLCKELEF